MFFNFQYHYVRRIICTYHIQVGKGVYANRREERGAYHIVFKHDFSLS